MPPGESPVPYVHCIGAIITNDSKDIYVIVNYKLCRAAAIDELQPGQHKL
jgi:hypothetical protein